MRHFVAFTFSLFFFLTGFAQPAGLPKPELFSNFPDIINCSTAELDLVFAKSEGQNIDLSFSNSFNFGGTVTSNVVKYANLQSVIIKSSVFNNAIFHISKRTNPDNSITYVGLIINQNYFDGYELKTDAAGNYKLIKIQTDHVIQIDSHH